MPPTSSDWATVAINSEAQRVLDFWFRKLDEADWFKQSERVDQSIAAQFLDTWQAASVGELSHWRTDIRGRVAEIIVLDQFPRNLFRGQAQAFSTDTLALVLGQEAVANDAYTTLSANEQAFVLMPYMHSESRSIHEQAIALFSAPGLEQKLAFEMRHKVIIDRFGRYPHRNAMLGRPSTPEETRYLEEGGETF